MTNWIKWRAGKVPVFPLDLRRTQKVVVGGRNYWKLYFKGSVLTFHTARGES